MQQVTAARFDLETSAGTTARSDEIDDFAGVLAGDELARTPSKMAQHGRNAG